MSRKTIRNPKTRDVQTKYVPLSELSEDQILRLPLSAFTMEELGQLTDDQRAIIISMDRDSFHRRQALAKEVRSAMMYVIDPMFGYSHYMEMSEDDIDDELAHFQPRWDKYEDKIDALQKDYPGLSEEDFYETMVTELANINNYEWEAISYGADAYNECDVKVDVQPSPTIDLGDKETRDDIRELTPYEIDYVFEFDLDEESDYFDQRRIDDLKKMIARKHFEYVLELDEAPAQICGKLRWDVLEKSFRSQIVEISDEPPPELGERVHTFADGAYVQSLTPEELPNEGKRMGMCVGKPEMGYIEALTNNDIRILSLRTEGGRPKMTISIELDNEGRMEAIEQIKGKANRLPGWNLGEEGRGKFKDDEFAKAIELVDVLGFRPAVVEDLGYGIDYVEENPGKAPKSYQALLGVGYYEDEGGSEPRSNPSRTFDEPYSPRFRENPSSDEAVIAALEEYDRQISSGETDDWNGWPTDVVAAEAGISVGAARAALRRLEKRGLVRGRVMRSREKTRHGRRVPVKRKWWKLA